MTSSDNKQASGSVAVLGMGSCYALGTFTDNFYKQAAILLAAASQMGSMQSIATVLFSLPFIVFSAWAGWLADRLPKKYIVVGAKSLELFALLAGSIMLVQGIWAGILAVIFIMGTQATLFSPAINGSIPENFPAHQVPRVNSLIKLASTAAILIGMALAGVFLDMRPQSLGGGLPDGLVPQSLLRWLGAAVGGAEAGEAYGRAIAALFVILVAVLGLLTSFILRAIPAAGAGQAPFPWTGPLDSFRHARECRKDAELFTVLICEAYFYGMAAIAVISIANMASDLGYSNTIAGLMTAVLMVGIAVGSLIAGRQRAESWRKVLAPSACGMALMLTLAGLSPLLPSGGALDIRLCWIFAALFFCGLSGGLYLIPLSSFIQIRPAGAEKGKVLAVSNFLGFLAMALSGAAFQVISLLPPNLTFIVYALCTLCFIRFFARPRLSALPGSSLRDAASGPLGLLLRALLSLRYKVTVEGLESIPPQSACGHEYPAASSHPAAHSRSTVRTHPDTYNGSRPAGPRPGMLFLPNHPALVDPLIVYSRIAGLSPRPLSDERQMRGLLPSLAARVIRAVTIPDLEKDGRKGREGVKEGIARIIAALEKGDNILLYPAGRVYRAAQDSIGGNSAVYQILAALPDVRVVLVRTTGLWGSSFSRANGSAKKFIPCLMRGLRTLLANGLFFAPRREVRLEFAEPANLPRGEGKLKLNAWLDDFYSAATRPAMAVPRWFWRGSAPYPLPEVSAPGAKSDISAVPGDIRERVWDLLREQADLPENASIQPEMKLRTDLHLDSLALMDLVSALEKEFGCSLPNLEGLETAGDCLAAAAGLPGSPGSMESMGSAGDQELPAPPAWFEADKAPDAGDVLTVPHGTSTGAQNVPQAFLRLAQAAPNRPLTAERICLRTRRQILVGALALAGRFKELPGKRLGIMLPAVPAALAVWLACLMAGKEPVFLNWTLGRRNIRHCIQSSGIRHAVTATALLNQLERTGISANDLPVECLAADKLAASLSFGEKVRAALRAFLHCSPLPWSIKAGNIPDTAAILFTSGSEAAPKAVPLSHENIMTNAADVAAVLRVKKSDRLLAMLPPFHSFGLLTALTIPAISGLAAAYHANPTESARLVSLVRDYKLTLMGATPTFLEAMLSRCPASPDKDDDAASGPLASLRYVFVGAEKCPDHVYRAFAAVCPEAALCEGYGITECSPVVSVNIPGRAVPGSIGHALPAVSTAVVRETADGEAADREVADGGEQAGYSAVRVRPGERGMLLVRGKSVFAGYLQAQDGEEAPADPFVLFEGKRWYRTGDLVEQDADGRLFFKGRLKRFVKIGGEMISLPLMESLLREAFAAREDLPEDGKPFIAVEARPGSEDAGGAEILAFTMLPLSARDINAVFRNAGMAPVFSAHRVVRVKEIPLLGTGKTDYRALQGLV